MAREEKQEIELVTDFVRGCGLCRSELEWLCVSDFYQRYPRGLVEPHWIHIDAMNGLTPFSQFGSLVEIMLTLYLFSL